MPCCYISTERPCLCGLMNATEQTRNVEKCSWKRKYIPFVLICMNEAFSIKCSINIQIIIWCAKERWCEKENLSACYRSIDELYVCSACVCIHWNAIVYVWITMLKNISLITKSNQIQLIKIYHFFSSHSLFFNHLTFDPFHWQRNQQAIGK